jgi:hypothetical protein
MRIAPSSTQFYGGAGWIEDDIFTIRTIEDYKDHSVLWVEGPNMGGIYNFATTLYEDKL